MAHEGERSTKRSEATCPGDRRESMTTSERKGRGSGKPNHSEQLVGKTECHQIVMRFARIGFDYSGRPWPSPFGLPFGQCCFAPAGGRHPWLPSMRSPSGPQSCCGAHHPWFASCGGLRLPKVAVLRLCPCSFVQSPCTSAIPHFNASCPLYPLMNEFDYSGRPLPATATV